MKMNTPSTLGRKQTLKETPSASCLGDKLPTAGPGLSSLWRLPPVPPPLPPPHHLSAGALQLCPVFPSLHAADPLAVTVKEHFQSLSLYSDVLVEQKGSSDSADEQRSGVPPRMLCLG